MESCYPCTEDERNLSDSVASSNVQRLRLTSIDRSSHKLSSNLGPRSNLTVLDENARYGGNDIVHVWLPNRGRATSTPILPTP